MSTADAVAGVLWVGVTLYAVFGGADFGAGFWSLFAGRSERGERVRSLIDWAIGPVWESNHVWLIFVLVVLWTAFSGAFAAVFSTLFIPLSLAALGIVLRGSGFAFQRLAPGPRERRVSRALFGLSSLLTPFFMGTVVGAVASGRVPLGNAEGDPVTSWVNAVSLLTGALFVATSAYLAAVFLVSDSRRAGDGDLERYFTTRALGAAVVAGALGLAGLFVFRADARYIYDGLVGEALPLVILSAVCGLGVLALLRRGAHRGARVLAAGALAAMIWAWGVAQFPYLLPETLTVSAGAADPDTLTEVLIVFAAAVLFVIPSLGLLYALTQRSVLEGEVAAPRPKGSVEG
ncbi:MAG: cytochrome d ubiquinol oxidase subunit II [bacterium]